jgi:hypothetical protein
MMSDELIQKAHEYIISDRPLRSSEETLADFAAECVKDALALADAADNYCDRCGDIVQVNAIERAIRAERERVAERLQILFEDVVNGSSPVTLLHGVMLTALIDELRGGK